MGKPTPPEPPDYAGAARAQGAANLEATRQSNIMGNPIISGPYGGQNVDYLPDNRPVITQYLSEPEQAIFNQQEAAKLGLASTANQQQAAIGNLLATPFSFGGSPQLSLGPSGPIAQAANPEGYQLQGLDTSQVARMPINAGTTAQQAIMARLGPELARRRTSAETQLANQGLVAGDEAYNNAASLLGQQENDALSQAALQGIGLDLAANQQGFGQALSVQDAANRRIQGNYGNQLAYQQAQNAAQQQGFGQGLEGAQFGNTALQQALAQALSQRNIPINEITALMSGSQVSSPQFQGYSGSVAAPAPLFNATQAAGDFAMNRYQQQVAQRNAMMGGLFGLAAAPFGMFNFG